MACERGWEVRVPVCDDHHWVMYRLWTAVRLRVRYGCSCPGGSESEAVRRMFDRLGHWRSVVDGTPLGGCDQTWVTAKLRS